MADNFSDRLRIAEKLAYLRAGGGEKSIGEKLAQLFGGIGQGLGTAGTGFSKGAEALKTGYEAKHLAQQALPIRTLFNVPSQEQEQTMRTMFEDQQTKNEMGRKSQLESLFQQPRPITQEQAIQENTLSQPNISQFASPREALQKKLGNFPIETPIGQAKEVAGALALGGQTQLYLDQDTGAVGITPTMNSIPIAKVPEKVAAGILASKERANIISEGAGKRQMKSQIAKEDAEKRKEERDAAREAEKMTADQEKTIKNLSQLKSLVDSYFGKLDELVPTSDETKGVLKATGRTMISKIPIVGSIAEPNVKAFERFREGLRPKIARALGDVGNLSQPEQESAIKLLTSPASSAAERAEAKSLIEEILFNSEQRAMGAVTQARTQRKERFLGRETGKSNINQTNLTDVLINKHR